MLVYMFCSVCTGCLCVPVSLSMGPGTYSSNILPLRACITGQGKGHAGLRYTYIEGLSFSRNTRIRYCFFLIYFFVVLEGLFIKYRVWELLCHIHTMLTNDVYMYMSSTCTSVSWEICTPLYKKMYKYILLWYTWKCIYLVNIQAEKKLSTLGSLCQICSTR